MTEVAFLGLGLMGEPMAANLLKSGISVTVWNRSPDAALRLQDRGAVVAGSACQALRQAPVAILMLSTGAVVDEVLERGTVAFAENVKGRTIIHMGTAAPDWSEGLEAEIIAAGGRYAECPVSGSRQPAQSGELVALIAGRPETVVAAKAVIAPMCKTAFDCGAVPGALAAKLAVNLFLITMVTGLAEAAHFARAQGVPLTLLEALIKAGPMASATSTIKLDKLVRNDLSPQAAIDNVLMNAELIVAAAGTLQVPLISTCETLLAGASSRGNGQLDMVALYADASRHQQGRDDQPGRHGKGNRHG